MNAAVLDGGALFHRADGHPDWRLSGHGPRRDADALGHRRRALAWLAPMRTLYSLLIIDQGILPHGARGHRPRWPSRGQ